MIGFDQIGFIVDDLDAAIARWMQNVGLAPFFVFRELKVAECFFEGEPISQVLSVGYTQAGSVQIELIQQLDDSPSVYDDAIAGQPHHLAIWTADYDATLASYTGRGYVEEQWGSAGQRYAYLSSPQALPMLEISETPARKVALNRGIAAACEAYDGHEPIRDGFALAAAVASEVAR